MHGITLRTAPSDWEILQQENGYASAVLAGEFQVHPAAIQVGVAQVTPLYRVVREDDNAAVIPWTPLAARVNPDFTGTFEDTIRIPAGGLYRIETSLETRSTQPGITWLYRGDVALHLGVGNVFIIAGQSNSAGHAWDYAMDPPRLDVHLYRNRSRWDLATHPMNESTGAPSLPNEEMGIPGVSPYLSFAKNFADFSHCPVGLVQTALGGSPMARWVPGEGDLYSNMVDKIRETRGRYAGVVWYQGCSDGDRENAPKYLERFTAMVQALRRELGYEIPFFTFQLNRFLDCREDDAWGQVRQAQLTAAQTLPGVHILSTTNCAMSDGIHNSAHAQMMLGEKLARQAAHHLLEGFPAFEAPSLERAEVLEDGRLCLTFGNMTLGFACSTGDAAQCGFTLEDAQGPIALTAFRANREDRNHIYLTPERRPGPGAMLSFAWQADPTRFPPVDEVTYLPPLSFYRRPLNAD
ncbi:MAG: sialate O-acetylesterase [Aristaeellaceae bacterium]